MKSRKHYTKQEKMEALFKYSLGEKPHNVLIDIGFDVNNKNIIDKKYFTKIIHKWKQELYLNKDFTTTLNANFNNGFFFEEEFFQEEDDYISTKYVKRVKQKRLEEKLSKQNKLAEKQE